jgi:hypothetical protein
MKMKFIAISSLLCLTLSACSTDVTGNGFKWMIRTMTLASGQKVKAGTYKPPASWQCRLIGEQYVSDGRAAVNFNMRGPVGYLQKQAIQYANENHLKPDYIYTTIQNRKSIFGVPTVATMKGKDINHFYKCKAMKV